MAQKRNYKKKNYRKKPNKSNFKDCYRMGDYHQWSSFNTSIQMPTNAASRTQKWALTNVARGDTLPTRNTNLSYFKNLQVTFQARNEMGSTRFLRVMVVALRGSTETADTVNWSDLFVNSTFTKSGPTGYDDDQILRINQDEYVRMYDRVIKIHPKPITSNDENTTRVSLNIKLNKYVPYAYNSSSERKNRMFLLWTLSEAPGLEVSATNTTFTANVVCHFYDVIRSTECK